MPDQVGLSETSTRDRFGKARRVQIILTDLSYELPNDPAGIELLTKALNAAIELRRHLEAKANA